MSVSEFRAMVEAAEQRSNNSLSKQNEERAFSALEVYGVPRERARTISNGIMVLAQRYDRQIKAHEATIAELTSESVRLKNEIISRDALLAEAAAELTSVATAGKRLGAW